MTTGTKIYYTGDVANQPDEGTVIDVVKSNFYNCDTFNILLDDGRFFPQVMPSSFSGGAGCRFFTLADYKAAREKKLLAAQARLREMGLN